ncbi:MAG TPA: DUF6036 family nucleotidyltransferase [Arachnia sp.]|nr:DUF6036 family nucleotidyltransferase [Arachnia sp.]HMT86812.1 DUF6036 family nucleotidyltransferase [Arachnia sp.]
MTDPVAFGEQEIRHLFVELSTALERRDEPATLFVVGGAAMSLAYDHSRTTLDVDAAFEPSLAVREAARELADAHGLDQDWLNDGAKGFMPGDDPDARVVFESDYLRVLVASPSYLLAMKLHSARIERDLDDAARLFNEVGYTTAEQARDLLQSTYGAARLMPKHDYVVEDVAARAAALTRAARNR